MAPFSRHKKIVPLEAAVAKIPNGAVVMPGGFMGVGSPQRLIDELVRSGAVTSRTSIRRVDLVVTELAMIRPTAQGLVLEETAPGMSVREVLQPTQAALILALALAL